MGHVPSPVDQEPRFALDPRMGHIMEEPIAQDLLLSQIHAIQIPAQVKAIQKSRKVMLQLQ